MKYECQAEIEVNQPPSSVFSWLFIPQHMKTWIVNVGEIKWITEGEPRIGSCFQIDSFVSRQAVEYIGEFAVFEQSSKIEKKFRLGEIQAGGWVPVVTKGIEYERLVSYTLTPTKIGTRLICKTSTNIPEMAPNVARISQKVEQQHLTQSLKRLKEVVKLGKFSSMQKLWFSLMVDNNYTFSPL
jgi:uncharacterized protein YndB with AHSA1/START domain